MILTDDEARMRDGEQGPAVAAAMDLLERYANALGAERLCTVRNVAGTTTQPSPLKARLVAEGGWDRAFSLINLDADETLPIPPMAVPTCQLQQGFGPDSTGIAPYPAEFVALQTEGEAYVGARGVSVLATCTPYQVGNLPVRGEHCAWMESSAVVYANSVLGARTNCEGGASTGAASLTGRVPCWGNHHEEHRRGTHLVRVETPVASFRDWGLLGYHVGEVVQEGRPVVVGDHALPDLTDLKHFGAAAASSGGVEMYHVPGITPDAPTVEAAFAGGRAGEPVVFGAAERRAAYERLNDRGDREEVDFVLLGCPHASLDQIRDVARALDGRRLAPDTELWILAPRALAEVAARSGYTATIRAAGGHVLTDSCPAMSRSAPPGTRVFATDSAKQAHYLPAILGIEAWFGTTAECVDAAVTGRWRGELR